MSFRALGRLALVTFAGSKPSDPIAARMRGTAEDLEIDTVPVSGKALKSAICDFWNGLLQ
ncbi:hypothetical protein BH09MYX1_BH09MYX1_50330 [soil metagenome]